MQVRVPQLRALQVGAVQVPPSGSATGRGGDGGNGGLGQAGGLPGGEPGAGVALSPWGCYGATAASEVTAALGVTEAVGWAARPSVCCTRPASNQRSQGSSSARTRPAKVGWVGTRACRGARGRMAPVMTSRGSRRRSWSVEPQLGPGGALWGEFSRL